MKYRKKTLLTIGGGRLSAWCHPIERYFDTTVAVVCISFFLSYFWLCIFKTKWAGDFQIYVAIIHSLYEDFWHPMHEALAVPGRYSNYYGPYLVAVGGFGKLLGLTGYRALQWAGVFNLAFYVASIFYFFRNHSLFKRSWLPPTLFILVSTLLQNQYYHWTSEMTFRSLMSISAYPSMFIWAIGLTCLGISARFLAGGSIWSALVIALLVWVALLSHPPTATWIVGIVGIHGLVALAQKRLVVLRRVVVLYSFLIIGIAMTPFWPYLDVIRLVGSIGFEYHPPFEGHPFGWMLWLYLLSIPCAIYFLWIRRHRFVSLGFAATFLVYFISQLIGISYGNRYIIFQAFFAQVAVAEAAAIGPLILLSCPKARQLSQINIRNVRFVFVIFTLVVLGASIWSPAVRKARSKGILRSPIALIKHSSPHDAYYQQFNEIREFLGPGDIVIAPDRALNVNLQPVTGARTVVAPWIFQVPDYRIRQLDTEMFFASETTKMKRDSLLAKYNANRILLGPLDLKLADRIERDYGPAAVRSESFILFVQEEESENMAGRLRKRGKSPKYHTRTDD